MADTYHLQVVVQDRAIFDGRATSIIAPGEDGYLGVLAGHAALLCTLGEGALDIECESGDESYRIRGGFLEVLDNEVTVLADSVIDDNSPPAEDA
jgi:F-type H+-transporting ATPase subunit epsilon